MLCCLCCVLNVTCACGEKRMTRAACQHITRTGASWIVWCVRMCPYATTCVVTCSMPRARSACLFATWAVLDMCVLVVLCLAVCRDLWARVGCLVGTRVDSLYYPPPHPGASRQYLWCMCVIVWHSVWPVYVVYVRGRVVLGRYYIRTVFAWCT